MSSLREEIKSEILSLAYSSANKGPDWSQDGVGLPALEVTDYIMATLQTAVLAAAPEKKTMKAAYVTGSDAGWGCTYGFNEAIDEYTKALQQLFESEQL